MQTIRAPGQAATYFFNGDSLVSRAGFIVDDGKGCTVEDTLVMVFNKYQSVEIEFSDSMVCYGDTVVGKLKNLPNQQFDHATC